jgi:hypothetical protein
MQLIRRFWDAAVALDAAAAPLDEATRFPICRPEALAQLFDEARLTPAQTTAIEVTTRFDDFDDLWQPFLGGQGPAPAYAMSLDEARRTRLRDAVRERMRFEPDGSIALSARAWAVRAAKPARELPRR